jgi:hypothetical protein
MGKKKSYALQDTALLVFSIECFLLPLILSASPLFPNSNLRQFGLVDILGR